MTHEECCSIILWAPTLIDLDVRTTPGMGLPDLLFPVAHSRIETPAVQNDQPYFFGHLDLPALRSLKITTNLESLYMSNEILFPFSPNPAICRNSLLTDPGHPWNHTFHDSADGACTLEFARVAQRQHFTNA
jgi:hypothetical protein